jgi:hypothetical protein
VAAVAKKFSSMKMEVVMLSWLATAHSMNARFEVRLHLRCPSPGWWGFEVVL